MLEKEKTIEREKINGKITETKNLLSRINKYIAILLLSSLSFVGGYLLSSIMDDHAHSEEKILTLKENSKGTGKEHSEKMKSNGGEVKSSSEKAKSIYVCPMHPEVRSDKPGRCPKCGMNLVLSDDEESDTGSKKLSEEERDKDRKESEREKERREKERRKINRIEREKENMGESSDVENKEEADIKTKEGKEYGDERKIKGKKEEKGKKLYHCPMHPSYVSDSPGECPICGMKLVPIEEEAGEIKEVPGAVEISPWKQQVIGVRYDKVRYEFVEKEIRAVGYIDYDERLIKAVSLKFSGWIVKLWADYEGKFVKKGEPLLKIYSPEIVSAQQDYLIALQSFENLRDSSPLKDKMKSLLLSAREKLLLFDIRENEIIELERTKKVEPYVVIFSPFTGFVIKKNVFEGQSILPDTEILKIADISRVWVLVDVFEQDIPFVRVGQSVKIISNFNPEESFDGKVAYVYPYLNTSLRTQRVRIEVYNPNYNLRPGMYVTAYLKVPLGKKLVVPEDAVIFSGERYYVFVRGESSGVLIPREVELGAKVGGFFVVKKGISEGDEVVVSANFLIDSESKLKEALKSWGGDMINHKHGGNNHNNKDDGNRSQNQHKHQHQHSHHEH